MTHTSDKLREELERWATNFILEANIAHLTKDGGNSFKSELMDYLVEKLVVKLETTLKDRGLAEKVEVWHKDGIGKDGVRVYSGGVLKNTDGKWELLTILHTDTNSKEI